MYLLAIDIETSGINPEEDRITEIGAVLWDVKNKRPVQMIDHLISTEETDKPIKENVTKINGITDKLLTKFGDDMGFVLSRLDGMFQNADYWVAHNADFEKSFLYKIYPDLESKSCIDTMKDVPYPDRMDTRKLEFLAALHGFINYFPHRALFDALTCLKLLSYYPFEEILKWASAEELRIKALVSYEQRGLAKNLLYQWSPEQKIWHKTIKDFQLDEEIKRTEPYFKIAPLD
jgi:DNA polymerase-3 subunit epsilon